MKRVWYLLSPTGFEVIIYTLLSAVLLLLGSYKVILKQISTTRAASSPVLQLSPSDFNSMLQSQNWTAVVSTIFFWSMVGLVLALIGWAFINTMIDLYNTYVVSTNFMHPRYFQQTAWWGEYLLHLTLRILTGLGIIVYAFALVRFLYPMWLEMFRAVLEGPTDPLAWVQSLLAVIGFGISMHVMIILFRLWAMKPRLMENR